MAVTSKWTKYQGSWGTEYQPMNKQQAGGLQPDNLRHVKEIALREGASEVWIYAGQGRTDRPPTRYVFDFIGRQWKQQA